MTTNSMQAGGGAPGPAASQWTAATPLSALQAFFPLSAGTGQPAAPAGGLDQLLQSVIPLLVLSQIGGRGVQPAQALSPVPLPGGPLTSFAAGAPGAAAPAQEAGALDLQAANSLLEDMVRTPIRKLFDYLQSNSARFRQLEACIPVVAEAVNAFAARDYARALSLVYQAYRYIAGLRATVPDLPSLPVEEASAAAGAGR